MITEEYRPAHLPTEAEVRAIVDRARQVRAETLGRMAARLVASVSGRNRRPVRVPRLRRAASACRP